MTNRSNFRYPEFQEGSLAAALFFYDRCCNPSFSPMIALRKRSKKKHLFHFRWGNFLGVSKKYQKAYAPLSRISSSYLYGKHGRKAGSRRWILP